jgi:hypothetical protein
MGDPAKHHYVPEFYLKWWTGSDGRLERFTRPTPQKIMVRRVFPSEIGFERHLYKAAIVGERPPQWLETAVFQHIDSLAAPVLRKMNATPPEQLDDLDVSAWSVFVRALFYRTPHTLQAIKNSTAVDFEKMIEAFRDKWSSLEASKTTTFEEFRERFLGSRLEQSALDALPNILVSQRVGQILNDLHRRIIVLPPACPDFLISDDFVVRTNGIMIPRGHFALPISPRRLLVMAYERQTLDEIVGLPARNLLTQINRWTVESARHFVAGSDRQQERFIRNRFGIDLKEPVSSRKPK